MKDKNVAAIFALIFGIFGVHRFYLGQTGLGVLYLMFCWLFGITAIIGLIDSIILFSMDNDEFDYKYNRKYLYPDARRYNTDFDRRERRFQDEEDFRLERKRRKEDEYRQERERRRASRRRQPQAPPRPTSTVPVKNPHKSSGILKYKEFDYEGAIEDFKKALSVDQKDIAVHFNLACSYSLMEEKENAFFHLSKAVEYGFVDFKKIQDHDALAYIRIQDEFDIFKRNGYRLNVEPSGPKEEVININNTLLEQIKQLGELREKGLLTEEEFEIQKRKLLD